MGAADQHQDRQRQDRPQQDWTSHRSVSGERARQPTGAAPQHAPGKTAPLGHDGIQVGVGLRIAQVCLDPKGAQRGRKIDAGVTPDAAGECKLAAAAATVPALVVILVLPAILGLLGTRINALSISDPTPAHGSPLWRRVAAIVQARPGVVAFLVTAVMLFAALPLQRIQLTRADARVLPSDNSARLVDSAVRSNFRDDPADSILLVQRGPSTFRRWMIKTVPPVTRVDRPRRLPGGVKVVEIHMNVDPNSDSATGVVKSIRDSAAGSSDAGRRPERGAGR